MSTPKKALRISVTPQSPPPARPATVPMAIGPVDPYLRRSRRSSLWREASMPKPWHPAKRHVEPSAPALREANSLRQGKRHLPTAVAAQSADVVSSPPASTERLRHKKLTTVSFIATVPNTTLTARRFSVSRYHRRKSLEAGRAAFVESTKPRSLGQSAPPRDALLKLATREQQAGPVLSGRRHFAGSSSIVPPWIAAS